MDFAWVVLDLATLSFKGFYLVLELFDHFLAKVRPLGKLLLNLLVDLNISFDLIDLCPHFVIFEEKLLSLLRLVI